MYMYFGGVMKMKKYLVPEIEFVALTKADILNGSDTIVNIGGLYGDAVAVSEYTGEPVEE